MKVVKVKYKLQWRSQDVQDIRNTWAPKKSAGTRVKRAQERAYICFRWNGSSQTIVI